MEKSSTFGAIVNLAKLCIGVGVLALPHATSRGGLIFAPVAVGLVAIWNAIACDKMINCKNACSDMLFPEELSSTYSKIAFAGSGTMGVLITDICIVITLLGVCVTYQIAFSTLLVDLPGNELSLATWTILYGVLAYPISCTKNVGKLAFLSFVGLIFLIVSILAILGYGLLFYGDVALVHPMEAIITDQYLTYWPETISDLAYFTGVATFCFGLCSLAFPVEESMQHREQFGLAVRWSLVFVWFMYTILGEGGAILYLHEITGIRGNILANLPPTSYTAVAVRVCMALVCLLTFPLTLVPPAHMIEHQLSKALSTLSVQLWPAHRQPPAHYGSIEGEHAEEDAEFGRELLYTDTPVLLRGVNRLVLVALITVFSAYIPCFGMVVSLLGSFTVAILSFVLPSYLHITLVSGNVEGANRKSDEIELMASSTSTATSAEAGSESSSAASQQQQLLCQQQQWEQEQQQLLRTYRCDVVLTVAGSLLCLLTTALTTFDMVERLKSGSTCS